MSGTTSRPSQGDTTFEDAVFRIPCRVRDMILHFIIRDYHLAELDPFRMSSCLELSVLRVSKPISRDVMEFLDSESVFVFVIDTNDHATYHEDERFSRLKRVAPLMKNIDIATDISTLRSGMVLIQDDNAKIRSAKKLERSLSGIIGLFESVGIERRNLHIRILNRRPSWFISTAFGTICQRLGRLVGFRDATVDNTMSDSLLLYYGGSPVRDPVRDTMARDPGKQSVGENFVRRVIKNKTSRGAPMGL